MGGVLGLALIAGAVWYLLRRKRKAAAKDRARYTAENKLAPEESSYQPPSELHSDARKAELDQDRQVYEMDNTAQRGELHGDQQHRPVKRDDEATT